MVEIQPLLQFIRIFLMSLLCSDEHMEHCSSICAENVKNRTPNIKHCHLQATTNVKFLHTYKAVMTLHLKKTKIKV